MSGQKNKAMDELKRHARTMKGVQATLLAQAEGDKLKVSDYEIDRDNAQDAIMPRIFALDSALIPFSAVTPISRRLEKDAKFVDLAASLRRDRDIRDLLSVSSSDTGRRILELSRDRLDETLTFIENAVKGNSAVPAPYGTFVDFDMLVWALGYVLDLKTTLSQSNTAKSQSTDSDETIRIETLVKEGLAALIQRGQEGLASSELRHGWYASLETMESLFEQRGTFKGTAGKDRISNRKDNLSKAFVRHQQKLDPLLLEIVDSPAFVESIFVATRAICVFVSIAKEVAEEAERESGVASETSLSAYFTDLETEVFRQDSFGQFCLTQLKKYTLDRQGRPLPLDHYDPFIHLTGILAFALAEGYFSPTDDDGKPMTESLRPKFVEIGFANRTAIIDAIVDTFEGPLIQALGDQLNPINIEENRFVATAELHRLFDGDGNLMLLDNVQKKSGIERDPNDKSPTAYLDRRNHSFTYLVALPIALKGLAQMVREELMSRLLETPSTEWKTAAAKLPNWVGRVETMCGKLVKTLYDVNINKEGDKRIGVWKGKPSWSVTAAVVDALSVWMGVLTCRVAIELASGEAEETLTEGIDFPSSDIGVVKDFFSLLTKYTSPPPAPPVQTQPESPAVEPSLLQWLNSIKTVADVGIFYNPSSNAGFTTTLGPEQVLKTVKLIKFISDRMKDETTYAEVEEYVCTKLIKDLRKEVRASGKMTVESVFQTLENRLKEKYPTAFRNQTKGRD